MFAYMHAYISFHKCVFMCVYKRTYDAMQIQFLSAKQGHSKSNALHQNRYIKHKLNMHALIL